MRLLVLLSLALVSCTVAGRGRPTISEVVAKYEDVEDLHELKVSESLHLKALSMVQEHQSIAPSRVLALVERNLLKHVHVVDKVNKCHMHHPHPAATFSSWH